MAARSAAVRGRSLAAPAPAVPTHSQTGEIAVPHNFRAPSGCRRDDREVTNERPLEDGWLPDTPVDDTILRQFVHNQAEANELTARILGGRTAHTRDVFLADTGTPVPYLNQAILRRPLLDPGDDVLDEVDGFFEGVRRPWTLLSMWPTPNLATVGWHLVGHPVLVVRGPGSTAHEPAPGVQVRPAASADDFATAEQVVVEGYPIPEAAGLGAGSLFPPAFADSGLTIRLGLLDGEVVGVGNSHVGADVVNLCLGATLPAARRQGVWEALVWARLADAPELPAVAYTSDFSRPGFLRMGFLPVTRFTLWVR